MQLPASRPSAEPERARLVLEPERSDARWVALVAEGDVGQREPGLGPNQDRVGHSSLVDHVERVLD